MVNGCAAHASRRVLARHLKTCSLVGSYTLPVKLACLAIVSDVPRRNQDFTPLLVLAHLDVESLPLAHGAADGAHLVRVSAF
jgi:hypothetical protein